VKQLADGVWQVRGYRGQVPDLINEYVIEDVLVDAGTRHSGKRILRELTGHPISALALTHAHADHQGASHEVCEALGVPYWVSERDADAAEDPELIRERQPSNPVQWVFLTLYMGPGHPVDRKLREGDEIAGFKVLDVPGHSAGHLAFWRESDRVLICGDVLANLNQITGLPGLNEPKSYLTPDPKRNRESARRLAALEPSLVLFGHGRPLRDTRKFVDFVEGLPYD
jgi:hydroxyacylglutathione hydrolase